MPLLVKKNSAETHISSTFATKQIIGYDKKLEDRQHSVTVPVLTSLSCPILF